MFQRFTQEARDVVVAAQLEARDLHHDYLGTEHLLVGLAAGPNGVLEPSALGADRLRIELERIIGRGHPTGMRDGDAEALRSIGIDLEEVRRRLEVAFGPGALERSPFCRHRRTGWSRDESIPFTPRAKRCLELGAREADRLGHAMIRPEHLLLGILAEGEGVAVAMLDRLGTDLDRLRSATLERIPPRGLSASG